MNSALGVQGLSPQTTREVLSTGEILSIVGFFFLLIYYLDSHLEFLEGWNVVFAAESAASGTTLALSRCLR